MTDIALTVNKESVYEEVAQTTSYTGAKMNDELAYNRIFTTDEDKSMLERFWNESKNTACNSLKKILLNEVEREGIYQLSLGLSSSFDEALTESMERSLFSFFVMNITAKWYTFTNKEEATGYASVHHGNTEKLVKSIAEECQVDLIDAVKQPDADLSSYDTIGFASGIYFSKFHQSILGFAEKNLPDDKGVFLICTYGGSANYKSIEQILGKKHSTAIGKFGCKGYDTFGPFKLVGGIAKGHPDGKDIKNAVEFVKGL